MIYHHDDAEQASAVMHYHADQVKQVGKLAERLLYIFAACIGLPLLAHLAATSDAAAALWPWLMSCDGVLVCALVAVPLRAKPHPGMPLAERAARNYPDSPALQQAYINAVQLVRSTKRGWLLDKPITRQERTQ